MKIRITAFDGFPEAEFAATLDAYTFIINSTSNGFVQILKKNKFVSIMSRKEVLKMKPMEFYYKCNSREIQEIVLREKRKFGYCEKFSK